MVAAVLYQEDLYPFWILFLWRLDEIIYFKTALRLIMDESSIWKGLLENSDGTLQNLCFAWILGRSPSVFRLRNFLLTIDDS